MSHSPQISLLCAYPGYRPLGAPPAALLSSHCPVPQSLTLLPRVPPVPTSGTLLCPSFPAFRHDAPSDALPGTLPTVPYPVICFNAFVALALFARADTPSCPHRVPRALRAHSWDMPGSSAAEWTDEQSERQDAKCRFTDEESVARGG